MLHRNTGIPVCGKQGVLRSVFVNPSHGLIFRLADAQVQVMFRIGIGINLSFLEHSLKLQKQSKGCYNQTGQKNSADNIHQSVFIPRHILKEPEGDKRCKKHGNQSEVDLTVPAVVHYEHGSQSHQKCGINKNSGKIVFFLSAENQNVVL